MLLIFVLYNLLLAIVLQSFFPSFLFIFVFIVLGVLVPSGVAFLGGVRFGNQHKDGTSNDLDR